MARWWNSVLPLLLATAAVAQPRDLTRWFAVANNPSFADVRKQLQVLVDARGHRRRNRLCVVGQESKGYRQAYVHWPAEDKLILWEPQSDNSRAMLNSRRFLDLRRDVVTGDDVHGSTYLLTRSDADQTIAACRRYGTIFIIVRRSESKHHS